MKNIFGTQKNVTLYHKNGEIAYTFYKYSTGYYWCKTHDDQGRQTSYKNSTGYSWTRTYDDQKRVTSYQNSDGVCWERVYNEDGTYKKINL